MGNQNGKLTKLELFMEKICPGAGKISANRWRNKSKLPKIERTGECTEEAMIKLESILKEEIRVTKKKKTKREEEKKKLFAKSKKGWIQTQLNSYKYKRNKV